MYHQSPIGLYNYKRRTGIGRYDLRYSKETAFYVYHYILMPNCCQDLDNRIKMDPENEAELAQFLWSELSQQQRKELGKKFREHDEMNQEETTASFVREMTGKCPFCSERETYSCQFCLQGQWCYLEIMHKPQFWTSIAENVFTSVKVAARMFTDKEDRTIYTVNLNRKRRNVMMVNEYVPRAFIYNGSMFADLFQQCPRHSEIEKPTLLSLCLNFLIMRWGHDWFQDQHEERAIAKLADELKLPSCMTHKIHQRYLLITTQTDLLEKLVWV